VSDRPPAVPCLLIVVPLEGAVAVRSLSRNEEHDRLIEWIMARPRLAELLSSLFELVREDEAAQ
jgi:hypothetical protein